MQNIPESDTNTNNVVPHRKMTEEELQEFLKKQNSNLSAELREQAKTHVSMVAQTMKHILGENATSNGTALLKPNELPQISTKSLLDAATPTSTATVADVVPPSKETAVEWSSLDEEIGRNAFLKFCESTPKKDQQWMWEQLGAAEQKRLFEHLERAIERSITTTTADEKQEQTAEEKETSAASSKMDNDLKSKARRVAAETYDVKKDVHVPLGIYPLVLMSYTGPSARCTTKTSEWSLRCWGGVSSKADADEHVEKIQSKNPYALNLDFFTIQVGGGEGGAPFPPEKNKISEQRYTNKEVERFMGEHNREITKSNQYHDERVKTKVDPSAAIRDATASAKTKTNKKNDNKKFVQKKKKTTSTAEETYIVRKADGTMEFKKRATAGGAAKKSSTVSKEEETFAE